MSQKLTWAGVLFALSVQTSMGAPIVYVDWDRDAEGHGGNPPVEPSHFVIDYDTDPNFPNVVLIAGSTVQLPALAWTWYVWSRDSVTGEVSDIGIISCPYPKDFAVTFADPQNPSALGARIVKAINLVPANAGSVIKYSNVTGGSISQLDEAMILKQVATYWGAPPTGVVTNFSIESIASGDLPDGTPRLIIPGGVSSSLHIGVTGTAAIGPVYPGAELVIDDLRDASTLYVTNMGEGGGNIHLGLVGANATVVVSCGCLPWIDYHPPTELAPGCCTDGCGPDPNQETTQISIDHMADASELLHRGVGSVLESLTINSMANGATAKIGLPVPQDVHERTCPVRGIVNLPQGIGSGAIVELYGVAEPGVVNLNGGTVAGTLQVDSDVAGQIVNVGEVSGTISVDGDLSGQIGVNGDIALGGVFTTGNITTTGSLNVGGALNGSLTVGGNMAGELEIASHINGPLTVNGNMNGKLHGFGDLSGTIDIDGALASPGGDLKIAGDVMGNGNIDVAGQSSGVIQVLGAMTTAAAKVRVGDGLASGSLIDVNSAGGALSTTLGTIEIVDATSQTPLTFDGAVRINYSSTPGTFAGSVKIYGCASVEDQPANICICGTNNGQIRQFGVCLHRFSVNCSPGCP